MPSYSFQIFDIAATRKLQTSKQFLMAQLNLINFVDNVRQHKDASKGKQRVSRRLTWEAAHGWCNGCTRVGGATELMEIIDYHDD